MRKENEVISVTGRGGTYGYEKSRLPQCLDSGIERNPGVTLRHLRGTQTHATGYIKLKKKKHYVMSSISFPLDVDYKLGVTNYNFGG
jgi:hypothetical protein